MLPETKRPPKDKQEDTRGKGAHRHHGGAAGPTQEWGAGGPIGMGTAEGGAKAC